MYYSELTQNQSRVSVDLHQTYEAYREALRNQGKYAGGIAWKTVSGRVNAGASAPEILVQRVVDRIRLLTEEKISQAIGVEEGVLFRSPKELT
jgi:hypothetical protein